MYTVQFVGQMAVKIVSFILSNKRTNQTINSKNVSLFPTAQVCESLGRGSKDLELKMREGLKKRPKFGTNIKLVSPHVVGFLMSCFPHSNLSNSFSLYVSQIIDGSKLYSWKIDMLVSWIVDSRYRADTQSVPSSVSQSFHQSVSSSISQPLIHPSISQSVPSSVNQARHQSDSPSISQ